MKKKLEIQIQDYNGEVKIRVVSFDKDLIKLNADDFLPRYNRIIALIENQTSDIIEDLLLTVTRTNSLIGNDNFWYLPIKTYRLQQGQIGKYELLAFDPFNEKFENIELRLTTTDDWQKRKVGEVWINRASEFSKRTE
jgi:hypothetical protein